MLTRAQRKVARIVLELVQEHGSVLAGGAAMNEAELIEALLTFMWINSPCRTEV